MSTVDDVTALALAAGQGDRAALSEFIRATQTEVWQFVARLSGSEAADDLTQETYLRVLDALASFRAQSSARTWLLTIARRVVIDRLRYEAARVRSWRTGGRSSSATWCVQILRKASTWRTCSAP